MHTDTHTSSQPAPSRPASAEVSGNDDFLMLSVIDMSLDIGPRVHGESPFDQIEITSIASFAAWFVWTVGGFALAWFQLHRLPVTR